MDLGIAQTGVFKWSTFGCQGLSRFLRAGYPAGMPSTGYMPPAALSRRRICDDEIAAITGEFMTHGRAPVTTADVGMAIMRVTNEMPSLGDIERV